MQKKILTYTKINTNGRLCNTLFFFSSTYGLARKSGRECYIGDWLWAKYFELGTDVVQEKPKWWTPVHEPHFHYCGQFYEESLRTPYDVLDIEGYLQTERYFKEYESDMRRLLTFKQEFSGPIVESTKGLFERPTIGIHVRRGDYVNNINYYNLPANYFISALEKYFPNWTEDYNVLIFSDDIKWCKTYLSGNNIYFSENREPIEDLFLLSQCQNFILSNSTFGWWGAWLSNTKGRIIRPTQYFEGPLKRSHDIRDFWPPLWLEHNYTSQKFDATDVTFMIPVKFDSADREANLTRIVKFLNHNFNTNIIVGEQGMEHFRTGNGYKYIHFPEKGRFHRTKILNTLCRASSTPIIVNYDADVIVPVIQILQAIKLCRKGTALVLPYDGRFIRLSREQARLDFSQIDIPTSVGGRPSDQKSVGGCVFYNKEKFLQAGMENENFMSYGPEDVERVERFGRLGMDVRRIKGVLWHYDHDTTPDSNQTNPYWEHNCNELAAIIGMNRKRLQEYIATWNWTKEKALPS